MENRLYKIVVNTKTNKITKLKQYKFAWLDFTERCDVEFSGYHESFYILPNRRKYIVSLESSSIMNSIMLDPDYLELKKLIENYLTDNQLVTK